MTAQPTDNKAKSAWLPPRWASARPGPSTVGSIASPAAGVA